MVPFAGIGPATSPLPRECSTTEPKGQLVYPRRVKHQNGLPKPNTAFMEREAGIEPASLAWKAKVLPLNYSRIRTVPPTSLRSKQKPYQKRTGSVALNKHFAGGEGWIRTSVLVRGQIYSLLPLTTRPPLRRTCDYAMFP